MANLFLLGGYDLEMLEIKNLLLAYQKQNSNSIEIADKELAWGARLSNYQEYLNKADQYQTIYGIELTEDIETPNNYVAIDHHNELANRPASIIQVSELLNIELDRWQQLVAANDSAYISGMLKIEATEKEIEAIRKADRQAQGVTEEDEAQAKIDVENGNWRNDVFVIETKLKRFSPIADSIWKIDKKIIFNETDINYYGHNKTLLVDAFSNMIKQNKAYHGGGEKGYFGFCDYSEKSALYVKKIIDVVANE